MGCGEGLDNGRAMKHLILRLMAFLGVQADTTKVWRNIEAQVGAQTPAVVCAREAFPDRDLCSRRQPLGVDGSDSASLAPEATGGGHLKVPSSRRVEHQTSWCSRFGGFQLETAGH